MGNIDRHCKIDISLIKIKFVIYKIKVVFISVNFYLRNSFRPTNLVNDLSFFKIADLTYSFTL